MTDSSRTSDTSGTGAPKEIGAIACGPGGCVQITREVADAIWAAAMEGKAKRQAMMPDEATAIRFMHDANTTLKEMGWQDPLYAPKNQPIQMLEAGSTGIHNGYRDEIGFWITDDDTWPSRPVLWRPMPPEAQS